MLKQSFAIVACFAFLTTVHANDEETSHTEAERAFDKAIFEACKAIQSAKAFSVTATNEWKFKSGETVNEGGSRLTVVAQKPDRFHIAMKANDQPSAGYIAASDGKEITRIFTSGKLYSVTPSSKPFHDLQTDAITVPVLHSTGCEFVISPDIHGSMMAQTVRINDLGIKESGGRKLRCFSLHLVSGRDVEFRFATEGTALPIEVITRTTVPVSEQLTATSTFTSTLQWDLNADPSADAFQAKIPKESKKVDDLVETILEPIAADIIGEVAPKVTFTDLDGKEISPAELRGKDSLVVFFWASWAAPDETQLASLRQVLKDTKGKGIKFLAVNVGESVDAIKSYVEEQEYQTPVVRDPEGKAMQAWRASIPSAVVIDQEGKIRVIIRGVPAEVGTRLREELQKLKK